MPLDKGARRARVVDHCTRPETLAIVRTYYPSPLRERVLICCVNQRAGRYARRCRQPLCPVCCPIESYKAFQAAQERFRACTPPHKQNLRLAHEVYTLPPHLRKRILKPDGYRLWADATRAAIRDIHQADVAGVMNLHPIGEENIDVFHPHWDVVVNGYLLTETGRPVEHRPPRIDYDDARAIYARHLIRAFDLKGEDRPRAVSIYLDRAHATFHSAPGKTRHILTYSTRHVYQPAHARLVDGSTEGDWWYQHGKDRRDGTKRYEGRAVIENLMFVQRFLRGRKRRCWFGYMQNRLVRESAAAFARHVAPEGAGEA